MQVKAKLNLKRNIVGKEDKKDNIYDYQFDSNISSMNHTWENAIIETDTNKQNDQLIRKKKIIKWILIIILSILVYIFLIPKPKSIAIIQKEEIVEVFDYVYCDSIPTYNSFNDIPAGIETRIIIDGILYEINDDKTLWTPAYLDEYIMWIGGNGDTIWE